MVTRSEVRSGCISCMTVDPGGTTGYALVFPGQRVIQAGELTGHEWEQVDQVLRLWYLHRSGPSLSDGMPQMAPLLVEAFHMRDKSLVNGAALRDVTLSPVRIGFALEWAVYRMAVKGAVGRAWASDGAVKRPTASDAKTFATDERLKRWNVYVPGDHARDAVRHACLWLAKISGSGITDGLWTAERV